MPIDPQIEDFRARERPGANRLNRLVSPINQLIREVNRNFPQEERSQVNVVPIAVSAAEAIGKYTAKIIIFEQKPLEPDTALTEAQLGEEFESVLAICTADIAAGTNTIDTSATQIMWAELLPMACTDGRRVVSIFAGGGTSVALWIRITGSTQDGGNKRWSYTFDEVEKTAAGYDGWTVKSGGISSTAYNTIEDGNGASGTFGNGVSSSNLVGTFDIQPVPDGVIIRALEVSVGGGVEYWFSYESGVDGSC